MRSRATGIAVLAALPFWFSGAPAAADQAALPRHLVYGFTFGTQSDLEVHSSGIDAGGGPSGGSGMTDFTGGVGDQGTITVDLLSQQSDGGIVIKVSEQAEKTRSEPAATCVVYPTTGVICDPNATINPEEMALIRFLAPTFVDPSRLDAKQHWKIDSSTPQYSLSSDFTIAKNTGGVMTIDESRIIHQQQPTIETTEVNATIGYDSNKSLPTSVSEYAIERSQAGMGQYDTVKTQTVLQLKSDSPGSH